MTVWELVAFVGGLGVVGAVMRDLVSALVVPQFHVGRFQVAGVVYRAVWRTFTAVARRVRSPERRERLLSSFAPLSVLGLLLVWMTGLLLGWTLVYWSRRVEVQGAGGLWSLVYFSGATLLTLGYGDLTPTTTFVRLLTIAEALSGIGTLTIVISYLPALYTAYGRREAMLLTLDQAEGGTVDAVTLLVEQSPDDHRDLAELRAFFVAWDRWTAEVLESHVAFPMLAFFRSQHRTQSWLSAIGVVADTAALAAATLEGATSRTAYLLVRRIHRTLSELATGLSVPVPAHVDPPPGFDDAHAALAAHGFAVRALDDARYRYVELDALYRPALEGLRVALLAPDTFAGHSARPVAQVLRRRRRLARR